MQDLQIVKKKLNNNVAYKYLPNGRSIITWLSVKCLANQKSGRKVKGDDRNGELG